MALDYINMGMTPATTYDQIWAMLDQRYDDPMAFNYNTLHRVFNTPQLLQPKSTQAHWDNAVGDIKSVKESGLTVSEILVYFRLHKFQADIVRRVKDLHRITYPGNNSINLEAIAFF